METELSFLLTLLLEHKLPKATKEAVKERIKGLEARKSPVVAAISSRNLVTSQNEAQANENILAQAAAPSSVPRIMGGEVNTGLGIKGPRKF